MFTRSDSFSDLQTEDFEIAMLEKTARRLSTALPLHQVLDEVVRFVTAVVKCDACLIYVFEHDELVLRASKNPNPEAVNRLKLSVGQGITGWVAQNRHPVAIRQRAYEDLRFKLFNELLEDRFEAFLSVPVVSAGRLVSVINVQNRNPHEYSEREIIMIATIGMLVGSEIERARLESENSALLHKIETRTAVDRAKAILQRNLGVREDEAYRTMQRESQRRRKSMRQIAEAIILSDDLKHPLIATVSAAPKLEISNDR